MAIPHAEPGKKITIPLLEDAPGDTFTKTLFKVPELEVMRMVVRKGREIPTHSVAGALTLQCLEGRVALDTMGQTQELAPGELLYLPANEPHALKGIEDSSLLLTLLL
jgi:quercetin dioxygenase-like cupin family protein